MASGLASPPSSLVSERAHLQQAATCHSLLQQVHSMHPCLAPQDSLAYIQPLASAGATMWVRHHVVATS
jgi:hypothetical protein